jgi:small-conductance mechanosensitive channel
MSPDHPAPSPGAKSRLRMLSRLRLSFTTILLGFLALCMVLAWSSDRTEQHVASPGSQGDVRGGLVDLHPWQTAQALAALHSTAQETEYAREAERLADHEVDQAFAAALRQAVARQNTLTGAALALSQKVAQLQELVNEDQRQVEKLTPSGGGKPGEDGASTDDLDVAKAQLGLDSDELTDAQRNLARASGDDRSRIQQELATHEAAMKDYDAKAARETPVPVVPADRYSTLASRLRAWMDQRTRDRLIRQAMRQAQEDAVTLTAGRKAIANDTPAAPQAQSAQTKSARIAALNSRAARREILGIYDDRIQTEQQLAGVYSAWSTALLEQHRLTQALVFRSFALIALIVLCGVLLDALVLHFIERPNLDRRRRQTLRLVFKLAIQGVGVLLILLAVFGSPRQMPTIVGLATAGLTLVLQDFIIAFFGWFVLMGKNGIHVGDWVEINGVGGEVAEIGLFRTAVMETGNWTDKGHPTGRRITFINSFAIRGQYFNFSTSGQWLWDELTVTVPSGVDVYEVVGKIHDAVLKETENDARQAAEEWKRITRQNVLGQFSAASTVDLRPGAAGIDIIVRYVTRASARFERRNRLYQCVIDLLHKPAAAVGPKAAHEAAPRPEAPSLVAAK